MWAQVRDLVLLSPHKLSVCVHFLQPIFNNHFLAHHPPEAMEEKSHQDMGEVRLLSSSSLGISSVFFASSLVPWQMP